MASAHHGKRESGGGVGGRPAGAPRLAPVEAEHEPLPSAALGDAKEGWVRQMARERVQKRARLLREGKGESDPIVPAEARRYNVMVKKTGPAAFKEAQIEAQIQARREAALEKLESDAAAYEAALEQARKDEEEMERERRRREGIEDEDDALKEMRDLEVEAGERPEVWESDKMAARVDDPTEGAPVTAPGEENEYGHRTSKMLVREYRARKAYQREALESRVIGQILAGAKKLGAMWTDADREKLDETLRLCTRLNFRGSNIQTAGVWRLVDSLRDNVTVRTVVLAGNTIADEGCAAVCEALKSNKCVTALDLGSNSLTEASGHAIGSLMQHSTLINALDVSRQLLRDAGAVAIARGVRRNRPASPLHALYFSSALVGAAGAKALAGLIASSRSKLRLLDLSVNRIGDAGARRIAEALRASTTIRRLNLASNGIGEEGGAALAHAVATQTSLRILNLSRNSLGPGIAAALEFNDSLVDVNFSNVALGDEGATAVATALLANQRPSLTKLNLTANTISDHGATQLARLLRASTVLRHIDMTGNHVSDKGASSYGAALRLNTTLTSLDFTNNLVSPSGALSVVRSILANPRTAIKNLEGLSLRSCVHQLRLPAETATWTSHNILNYILNGLRIGCPEVRERHLSDKEWDLNRNPDIAAARNVLPSVALRRGTGGRRALSVSPLFHKLRASWIRSKKDHPFGWMWVGQEDALRSVARVLSGAGSLPTAVEEGGESSMTVGFAQATACPAVVLLGAAGTGKTTLAYHLAPCMKRELIRLDGYRLSTEADVAVIEGVAPLLPLTTKPGQLSHATITEEADDEDGRDAHAETSSDEELGPVGVPQTRLGAGEESMTESDGSRSSRIWSDTSGYSLRARQVGISGTDSSDGLPSTSGEESAVGNTVRPSSDDDDEVDSDPASGDDETEDGQALPSGDDAGDAEENEDRRRLGLSRRRRPRRRGHPTGDHPLVERVRRCFRRRRGVVVLIDEVELVHPVVMAAIAEIVASGRMSDGRADARQDEASIDCSGRLAFVFTLNTDLDDEAHLASDSLLSPAKSLSAMTVAEERLARKRRHLVRDVIVERALSLRLAGYRDSEIYDDLTQLVTRDVLVGTNYLSQPLAEVATPVFFLPFRNAHLEILLQQGMEEARARWRAQLHLNVTWKLNFVTSLVFQLVTHENAAAKSFKFPWKSFRADEMISMVRKVVDGAVNARAMECQRCAECCHNCIHAGHTVMLYTDGFHVRFHAWPRIVGQGENLLDAVDAAARFRRDADAGGKDTGGTGGDEEPPADVIKRLLASRRGDRSQLRTPGGAPEGASDVGVGLEHVSLSDFGFAGEAKKLPPDADGSQPSDPARRPPRSRRRGSRGDGDDDDDSESESGTDGAFSVDEVGSVVSSCAPPPPGFVARVSNDAAADRMRDFEEPPAAKEWRELKPVPFVGPPVPDGIDTDELDAVSPAVEAAGSARHKELAPLPLRDREAAQAAGAQEADAGLDRPESARSSRSTPQLRPLPADVASKARALPQPPPVHAVLGSAPGGAAAAEAPVLSPEDDDDLAPPIPAGMALVALPGGGFVLEPASDAVGDALGHSDELVTRGLALPVLRATAPAPASKKHVHWGPTDAAASASPKPTNSATSVAGSGDDEEEAEYNAPGDAGAEAALAEALVAAVVDAVGDSPPHPRETTGRRAAHPNPAGNAADGALYNEVGDAEAARALAEALCAAVLSAMDARELDKTV